MLQILLWKRLEEVKSISVKIEFTVSQMNNNTMYCMKTSKTKQLVPKQLNLKGRKHALVTMLLNNFPFNALKCFM